MVAVIALHPSAIDLARDFKPYSLGLAFHLGVAVLALDYLKARSARKLWLTLGLAMLGVLFAQDIIFVYPGLFLALLARRLSRPEPGAAEGDPGLEYRDDRHLTRPVLRDLAEPGWRQRAEFLGREVRRVLHGRLRPRLVVLHLARPPVFRGGRDARHSSRTLRGGGHAETPPPVRAQVDKWLWFAIHVAGVAVLLRRRRLHECLLLFGPLLVLIFFNAIGRWPFGAFRTNLFSARVRHADRGVRLRAEAARRAPSGAGARPCARARAFLCAEQALPHTSTRSPRPRTIRTRSRGCWISSSRTATATARSF